MIGVEPTGAPTLTRALRAGQPVDAEAGSVAIDSLAPRRVGQHTFAVIREFVRQVVLVSDEDIAAAQELLWDRLRLVAEPGGCAALAALLSRRVLPRPGRDGRGRDQRGEHHRGRLPALTSRADLAGADLEPRETGVRRAESPGGLGPGPPHGTRRGDRRRRVVRGACSAGWTGSG